MYPWYLRACVWVYCEWLCDYECVWMDLILLPSLPLCGQHAASWVSRDYSQSCPYSFLRGSGLWLLWFLWQVSWLDVLVPGGLASGGVGVVIIWCWHLLLWGLLQRSFALLPWSGIVDVHRLGGPLLCSILQGSLCILSICATCCLLSGSVWLGLQHPTWTSWYTKGQIYIYLSNIRIHHI